MTTGYERAWVDDLRVLQDSATETLAEQDSGIRVVERRRKRHGLVLGALIELGVAAAAVAVVVLR